jgi:hypothetical protein
MIAGGTAFRKPAASVAASPRRPNGRSLSAPVAFGRRLFVDGPNHDLGRSAAGNRAAAVEFMPCMNAEDFKTGLSALAERAPVRRRRTGAKKKARQRRPNGLTYRA